MRGLVYTGTFNTSEALNRQTSASRTFFSGPTAFTIHALFNDSSPNIAPFDPFNTSVAYAPTFATIDILGTHYSIETRTVNPLAGVTVAIFDTNNNFAPGRYGIGLTTNPINDGAGIIGVSASASPNFVAQALRCRRSSPATTASAMVPVPALAAVRRSAPRVDIPWVSDHPSNALWNLTSPPTMKRTILSRTRLGRHGRTAEHRRDQRGRASPPEPSTWTMMILGFAGVGFIAYRRPAIRRSPHSQPDQIEIAKLKRDRRRAVFLFPAQALSSFHPKSC